MQSQPTVDGRFLGAECVPHGKNVVIGLLFHHQSFALDTRMGTRPALIALKHLPYGPRRPAEAADRID
ncbi:hypothetical protein F750_6899 [Streptomyces sp. PAMC 26508]|nr:hypothetical protein F750_6899 [Streptomyces sp. PAMC 26508]